MLIETYKEIHENPNFYMSEIDGNKIRVILHCDPLIEEMFPVAEELADYNKLIMMGFKIENRIDCRNRSEDYANKIIYRFELEIRDLTSRDREFIAEYHHPANRFYKYTVLEKYGITQPIKGTA